MATATGGGEHLACRFLVSGLGQLNRPNTPEFPWQGQFQRRRFHSALWDHSVDLAGKRVAVIGNAASAIQFIPPVARQAEQVYVYQRSANYIVPRNDRGYSEAQVERYRVFPGCRSCRGCAGTCARSCFSSVPCCRVPCAIGW